MTGAHGGLGTVSDKLGAEGKKARCPMALHFVCVIESSWVDLQKALNKPERRLRCARRCASRQERWVFYVVIRLKQEMDVELMDVDKIGATALFLPISSCLT